MTYPYPVMPDPALRAANIILDTVVGQTPAASDETNRRAYEIATELLGGPHAVSSANIEVLDFFGAAVVCNAWLAHQLAGYQHEDLPGVISQLRDFLRSVSAAD
ncbi:hypothetical protein [Pseudoclavibacter sp. AY1H1]|uniref:hypothetical protein n=1 Tax=Pseudoclavibacter sp. AY1H1 TaxID=2080584 RepID=UPI0011B0E02E|nr:hypothetical protein [Pseudoclavibacter sp. AY1H1]